MFVDWNWRIFPSLDCWYILTLIRPTSRLLVCYPQLLHLLSQLAGTHAVEVGAQISVIIVSLLPITAMVIEQGSWHSLSYAREGINFLHRFLARSPNCKKRLLAPLCMCVHMFYTEHLNPTECTLLKFCIWGLLEICREYSNLIKIREE